MTCKINHNGDGETVLFPFPFFIPAKSALEVRVDGTIRTEGFYIIGAACPKGGKVVFDIPPASGEQVSLRYRGGVSVTVDDATFGHLADKLVAGANVTMTTETLDGGVQKLRIDAVTSDLTKAMADGLYLAKSTNLADIPNKDAALANLGVTTAISNAVAPLNASVSSLGDTVTTLSGNVLKKVENLSDVPNKETARDNLGVTTAISNAVAPLNASVNSLNTTVTTLSGNALKKVENLSDVPNKETARDNLGVTTAISNAVAPLNASVNSLNTTVTTLSAGALTNAAVQQTLRDQIALTNIRLLLNTSVSSGALAAGKMWELVTDEWGATSANVAHTSGSPGYYSNAGQVVFSYTGDAQSFVVPPGVTSLSVKLWGGGGAGSYGADHPGAGGGYTYGNLVVVPGETLTVVVGQGGQVGSAATVRTYGGGGRGYSGSTSGAGRSAIRRGGVELATAGGGGGGGSNFSGIGYGGGLTGGNGYGPTTGGSQTAGGIGTYGANGEQYQGGDSTTHHGGGGGWYGGGANEHQSGGGSGYVGGLESATASTVAATSRESAGAADADYVAGIGRGNALAAGGNGQVVLGYAGGMRLAVPAAVTLNTAPSFADLYFLWKDDSGAAVLGSDISVTLSRNGGTTKTAATLTEIARYDGTYSLIRARADVSGQPVGTSLWAEITTTPKLQRVAAPGLYAE